MNTKNLREMFSNRLAIINSAIKKENTKRLKKYRIEFSEDAIDLVATYLDKISRKIYDKINLVSDSDSIHKLGELKKYMLNTFTLNCIYAIFNQNIISYGDETLRLLEEILN